MTPGQVCCEAWTRFHEENHPGCHFTPWSGLTPIQREAWEQAAEAVRQDTGA
jgi:hypothetical protein